MIFSTSEQFVVLAIVLVAGYLLGFASRPGTRKWKTKVRDQAESFTAYHTDAEDRIRAARDRATALESEAAALRADRDEAERTIAALKAAPDPAPAPAPDPDPRPAPAEAASPRLEEHPAAAAPVALSAARPAFGIDHRSVGHAEPANATEEPHDTFAMTPTPSAADPAPIGPAEPNRPSPGDGLPAAIATI